MDGSAATSIPRLKERTLQLLALAGLSQWECKALVRFLMDGPATPQGLAAAVDIPKNKVYEVLAHLVRRNLVYLESAADHVYHAVRPEVVFEVLLERPRAMEGISRDILIPLSDRYDSAQRAASPESGEPLPTVTDNRAAMNSLLMGDVRVCRSEILMAGHDLAWLEESPALLAQLEEAARGGVKVRLLSDDGAGLERIVGQHPSLMARVPRFPPLQSPIIVVGRRAVYMGVARGPGRAKALPMVYVRMRSPELTADMVRLFRETWGGGQDAGPAPTTGPASPES